jgi:hypothetical protein
MSFARKPMRIAVAQGYVRPSGFCASHRVREPRSTGTRAKGRGWWVCLVIVSMGVLISASSSSSAEVTTLKPIRWLLNGSGVGAITSDAEASRALDNSRPFVMMGSHVGAIPRAWHAVPFASFTSFRAMSSTLEGGALPRSTKGIMYDNEKWRFTPEEEQKDPARYEKFAADLVHAHGLLFLAAPAVDLVTGLAPGSDERRYDSYLRLGIATIAARDADVFVIQAQGSERNIPYYAGFVGRAAAQARTANPKVIVLAGISTNPNGQRVTADQILGAIAATRDSVDGYWFNIPQPSEYCPRCNDFRPDIAVEVLRRLAASWPQHSD